MTTSAQHLMPMRKKFISFHLKKPFRSIKKNYSNSMRPLLATIIKHYCVSLAMLSFQLTLVSAFTITASSTSPTNLDMSEQQPRRVAIIGGGWAGLAAAHTLSRSSTNVKVTLIEASPRVGGLVRDGFMSTTGKRPAEAGQHGFWKNYHNIFQLLRNEIPGVDMSSVLTEYAEQGQYSPRGLEAIWPVYQNQPLTLPTGIAQAAYTRFLKLPLVDRLSAFPLVLAFSEFDDSPEAWERFDSISFRDLCVKLGVSRRCYQEAFEPMILTGLFAPGAQCSAAAALGMAYFFVLQSQAAFDVQWCRGNIGEVIFEPWVKNMQEKRVQVECGTRVTGFNIEGRRISSLKCQRVEDGTQMSIDVDDVIIAVGAKALNAFVRFCPELGKFEEFRNFANLRGTSVLATRVFLDRQIDIPYSANACWGFDEGIGMTVFNIKALHGDDACTVKDAPGSVIEVDFYHANKLLVMSDDEIVEKVKKNLDVMFNCGKAKVVDAAVVRLPDAVNWYFPGSYQYMPDSKSNGLFNLYFAGDIVRTRHGSWSQEKAFVTGVQAANLVLGRDLDEGVLPLSSDEIHVKLGKEAIAFARRVLGGGDATSGPSLVDFLW